jgi:hypothetical protein
VALLRAGKVEATSKGQVIESALSLDARNTFPNNNLFRQASFRPKVNETDMKDWADAAQAFEAAFGKAMPDISNAAVVASTIRAEVAAREVGVEDAHALLRENGLPGVEVLRSALDQMRSIRSGKEDNAILTFNTAHKEIREAVKRSAELAQALTAPRLHDLDRAKRALGTLWPILEEEPDLDPSRREHTEKLRDLMAKETFFRELPAIDEHTRKLEAEYQKLHQAAVQARVSAYEEALAKLKVMPGWEQLNEEQQKRVSVPLASRSDPKNAAAQSIPLLRADVHACPGLLSQAIEEALRHVDGNRVVRVTASSYFSGGIETEEQLDQALGGLKEQCLELIGAGKKILVQ